VSGTEIRRRWSSGSVYTHAPLLQNSRITEGAAPAEDFLNTFRSFALTDSWPQRVWVKIYGPAPKKERYVIEKYVITIIVASLDGCDVTSGNLPGERGGQSFTLR
jgi:hypothetical protein